jgi:hypothetical protein
MFFVVAASNMAENIVIYMYSRKVSILQTLPSLLRSGAHDDLDPRMQILITTLKLCYTR